MTLHGAATGRLLRSLPLEAALLLDDCEGAEASILDTAAVTALSSAK